MVFSMPPTHPTHQPHPTELYYSNEDVQILHDIVVLAQELLPTLPERERLPTNALFNAYYDILPRVGINADHDSRYARILFKIGGLRGPGTLFQKFEDVLDRMGIDIQFSGESGEEDNDQLENSQTGQQSLTNDGPFPQPSLTTDGTFPQHNLTTDADADADGAFSQQSLTTDGAFSEQSLTTDRTSPTNQSNSLDELASKFRKQHLLRNWKEKLVEARQKQQESPNRSLTIESPTKPRSNSLPNEEHNVLYPVEHSLNRTTRSNSLPGEQDNVPQPHEQLANRFRKQQLLRAWRERALRTQQQREEREEVAHCYDKEALLQSALDAWRNRLYEQQQELRVTSISRKYWDIWREKVEERRRQTKLAEALYKKNILRSFAARLARPKVSPTAKILAPKSETIRSKVPSTVEPSAPIESVDSKVPSTLELSVPMPKIPDIESKVPATAALLNLWRERSGQEVIATKVDHTKLLKEAMTVWRHKIRVAEMRDRLDDRLKGQALRAWILAARSRLAEYRRNESSLRVCLRAWKAKQEIATAQRQEREEMAQSFVSQQSANGVLRQWYSKMEAQQRNETAAVDFHAPRLVSNAITRWSEKSKQIQHLEQRSRDADFYFLASRSLKAWKAATEASKREKRKQAYIQVRRNGKVNLAKGVLEKWRSKARPIMELQAQALKVRQDRDVVLAIDLFDRWRARRDHMQALGVTADEQVLRKHLISWKDRLKVVEAVDTGANLHYQETQESKHFKKWGLKTLQIRAHNTTAAEVREKNSKRNARRIFGYWRQRTELRRLEKEVPSNVPHGPEYPSTPSLKRSEKKEVPVNVPPIPGYLNTPSRRSVRFTTTPRTQLSTPAERRLRAQWS